MRLYANAMRPFCPASSSADQSVAFGWTRKSVIFDGMFSVNFEPHFLLALEMSRASAIFGMLLLVIGSIPFSFLSLIWLVFVGTALFAPFAWNLELLLSIAKVVALMALFWFGAFHVGSRLASSISGKAVHAGKWLLPLGSLALVAACVAIWSLSLRDTKALFPAPAFLGPLLSVPFAFFARRQQ